MQIKEKIEKWIKETLGTESVVLVHPKELEKGDFALILPPLSVLARRSLGEAGRGGEGVIEKLVENKLPEIERIELVNERFVNFFLSKQFFADSIEEINKEKDSFGKTDLLKGEKIIVEHTQPNPFKEFHIGHLMNNAIGESIARIVKESGAEVKTCSYHGDVGLHVAKAVCAVKDFEEKAFPGGNTPLKEKSMFWGSAYAIGSDGYEISEECKKETIEINKKIYDKTDPKINRIYEKGKSDTLEIFQNIYKKLDSHFDKNFFESESGKVGEEIVKENIGKVFEESEGAVVFRGENFEPKTHTRVFLNKDGLPTYEAKEVGLAKIKREFWPEYTKSITVTADEQDSFFKVVEVAIGQVFPELKGKLTHLSHGILKLPTGKMSSRTGNVVTAESMIEQVKEKILEKLKDRDYSEKDKNEIAEAVAIGAIKYSILRQAIGGDIIFDFDKSISFEGDSGPYLQYTAVRAKSVLGKAKDEIRGAIYEQNEKTKRPENFGLSREALEKWEIQEVERLLYRFPEVVERAATHSTSLGQVEYAPHHVVTYLTELAASFNSFYANNKILDEGDQFSPYKIAITEAVYHTLKNGLALLAIKVPEKM